MTRTKKNEEWRAVVGYEGLYEVSSLGRVRSVERGYIDKVGRKRHKLACIRHNAEENGYMRINLVKDGKQKRFFVHRLVAEAFIDNPNGYELVNHKDENKLNNCVENLEWCTPQYNVTYGTAMKRAKAKVKEKHYCTRPIIATTKDGTKEFYYSANDAARKLHISHTGISNVLTNRARTAAGRTWEYAEVKDDVE